MIKRKLIYTEITRGKRLVVLVGQRRALAMAVKRKQVKPRWSKLRRRQFVLRSSSPPVFSVQRITQARTHGTA
ncbi:MAG: hypothetical protein V5B40_02570 [Candidatus Accumulibacter meliphilus]|jgi:ATP-dependent exoDNAse (exonuclease V) alpha subunit